MATNIECFDVLVGRLFADLYDDFPVRVPLVHDFYAAFLMGLDKEHPCDPMFDDRRAAVEFLDATASWLKLAGYITYSGGDDECLGYAVLTPRGLQTLRAIPESLMGESLGSGILGALKTGALDKLQELTSIAIGKGVQFGLDYLNG